MAKKKTNTDVNYKKIHISFSEFQLYANCGHRHLIEKYLGLEQQPPSIHLYFGSAIHEAIEFGIKEKFTLEKRIAHFQMKFAKDMSDNMIGTSDFNSMKDFLIQGEHILRYVITEKIFKKYEIIGVEEPLYEPMYVSPIDSKYSFAFYFKGFIDLIVRGRKTGRYVIIDWKTSGQSWNEKKKKEDKIFVSQTRFYKYFYCVKHSIPFDQVDCKYVVLNRLKNKKNINEGLGEIQTVEMNFSLDDIKESLHEMIITIRDIHIRNYFPKAKIKLGSTRNCYFCPFKDGHYLCNGNPNQSKSLITEYKNNLKTILKEKQH